MKPTVLSAIHALCMAVCIATVPAARAALASPLASLPMVTEPTGLVHVSVTISGIPLNLRLDAAPIRSMLTDSVAAELKLTRNSVPYRQPVWYNGAFGVVRLKETANADSLQFGSYKAPWTTFYIVPDGTLPVGVGGQLGPAYLRQFDIEFDFPNGALNIFSPGQCTTAWSAGSFAQLPIELDRQGLATMDVQLDGKKATALIDTDSARTLLKLASARTLFGIDEQSPGMKVLASHNGVAYLLSYPFKTLALQNVSISNPDVEIHTKFKQDPDIVLGASVLRQLDFCIAYNSERLLVRGMASH